MRPKLAAVILAYNEARHLPRALASLQPLHADVVVIDSGSSDRTCDIAREYGAVVLTRPFVNHADQFDWALRQIPADAEWVMRLDADEIIEPDLAAEIADQLPQLSADVCGVNLNRKHIFMNRWIRHGGRYPLPLLRIWRRGTAQIEHRWMDEHMVLARGRTVTFRGGFSDHNLGDLASFIEKHNGYATREAVDVLTRRHHLAQLDESLTAAGTSSRTARTRWVKEKIYNHIPYQIGAPLYFLYRYVLRLGFLDGREGLIYHFLQGFWYRFLVGARTAELEQGIAGLHEPAKIRAELEKLTGLPLGSGDSIPTVVSTEPSGTQ